MTDREIHKIFGYSKTELLRACEKAAKNNPKAKKSKKSYSKGILIDLSKKRGQD